ncbi:MAG TPA: hypothetical protein VN869_05370 [Steroidobacteraceae bacterium]|nr:hypothetical protein [Steroidobacteraceae bacterium]
MAGLFPALPLNAVVARFVDRLTTLSEAQWHEIQQSLTDAGIYVSMLEASRNASVALAVRDMISHDQFTDLYRPFETAIPIESLDGVIGVD